MPLQKCRRACAQIDGDVEHPAAEAADQFHLGMRRALEMQPADGAGGRVREWLIWTMRRSPSTRCQLLGAEEPVKLPRSSSRSGASMHDDSPAIGVGETSSPAPMSTPALAAAVDVVARCARLESRSARHAPGTTMPCAAAPRSSVHTGRQPSATGPSCYRDGAAPASCGCASRRHRPSATVGQCRVKASSDLGDGAVAVRASGRSSRPRRIALRPARVARRAQIAAQAVQHVLPRPRRLGRADRERLAALRRAHQVGNQPVLGPVAAADDVAGARRGERGRPSAAKKARR